uniref:Uncharacterized protein LOC108950759 n=1 Tax=Phallusia mammillata TaxID=59560 RepID=A0A6F9DJF1_9ASCI|nr:uncharacterized protein LOC108950759 [Phallusia mammillata]
MSIMLHKSCLTNEKWLLCFVLPGTLVLIGLGLILLLVCSFCCQCCKKNKNYKEDSKMSTTGSTSSERVDVENVLYSNQVELEGFHQQTLSRSSAVSDFEPDYANVETSLVDNVLYYGQETEQEPQPNVYAEIN